MGGETQTAQDRLAQQLSRVKHCSLPLPPSERSTQMLACCRPTSPSHSDTSKASSYSCTHGLPHSTICTTESHEARRHALSHRKPQVSPHLLACLLFSSPILPLLLPPPPQHYTLAPLNLIYSSTIKGQEAWGLTAHATETEEENGNGGIEVRQNARE